MTGTTLPAHLQPALATEVAQQTREAASKLLVSLANSDQTEFVEETPTTVVLVKRAGYVGLNNATAELGVWDFGVGDVEVTLPLENFAGLLLPDEEAGLSIATFGNVSDFNSAEEEVEVLNAIEVTLFAISPEGTVRTINASRMAKPVEIQMGISRAFGASCAYWSESAESWSDYGVTAKATGVNLTCIVSHLSLFGAILQGFTNTFLCSHAALLSSDGIRGLYEEGIEWLHLAGSVTFFIVNGLCLLIFICALYFDRWSTKHSSCPHVHLLIPLEDPPVEDANKEDLSPSREDRVSVRSSLDSAVQESLSRCQRILAIPAGCMSCLIGCLPFNALYNALKEAFDDAMSSWLEYFGEVRSILAEVWDAMECRSEVGPTRRCLAASTGLLHSTALVVSTRLTAAKLLIHPDVVTTIIEDEDLRDMLSKPRVDWAETPSTPRGQMLSKKDLGNRTADRHWETWKTLYDEVSHAVTENVADLWKLRLTHIVPRLFVVNHPIGEVFVYDLYADCRSRAFAFWIDHLLTLTLMTLFLEAAGTKRAKNRTECDESPDELAYKVGRFLAISVAAAVVSAFPVSLLESIRSVSLRHVQYVGCPEWHQALRAWRTQMLLYYIAGLLIACFCIFFILVFFANVSSDDHWNWCISWIIICVQDFIVVPLIQALALPLLDKVLLFSVSRATQQDKEKLLHQVKISLYGKTNLMLPLMVI